SFEEEVQQVCGGQRVVERPVRGAVVEAEASGQRSEATRRYLVAYQATGEWERVDDRVGDLRIAAANERAVDERHVEADVVAAHAGVAEELDHGGHDGVDRRGQGDHRLGDPRQHGDHR